MNISCILEIFDTLKYVYHTILINSYSLFKKSFSIKSKYKPELSLFMFISDKRTLINIQQI